MSQLIRAPFVHSLVSRHSQKIVAIIEDTGLKVVRFIAIDYP